VGRERQEIKIARDFNVRGALGATAKKNAGAGALMRWRAAAAMPRILISFNSAAFYRAYASGIIVRAPPEFPICSRAGESSQLR
jgi:hypothetical protein